jgi:FkbM family methyltransferase
MTLSQLKARFEAGTLSKADFIREALALHGALFDYVDTVRNTDVREIQITREGIRFIVDTDSLVLYCPPGESRVAPIEIMNFARYEPAETRVMDLLVQDAASILDIGANIGWYSVRLARRNAQARVYAFEPMPTSHAYLQRNIAANAVGQQVTAFNHALSDSSGSFELFMSPAAGTNASLKNVSGAEDAKAVLCLSMTLDQWASNHGVAPDFIKCDVEGAELLVFKGGQATLAAHLPVVFTELLRKWSKPFGYHPNDVIALFAKLGYGCFAIGAQGTRSITTVTDETVETNYAFLHQERHARLISQLDGR